jgi:hypothetical protein
VATGPRTLQVELPFNATGIEGCRLWRTLHVEENIPIYEDFDILTGSITGRMVNESDGQPVRGEFGINATLRGEDNPYYARLYVTTDPDGTFQFKKAPMGVYTVGSASPEARCTVAEEVKVFPGRATDPVVLERKTPITVSGYVRFTDSMKGKNWWLLYFRPIEDSAGNHHSLRMENETGAFSTEGLTPGRYEVYFYADPYENEYEPTIVEIPPGGTVSLELQFTVKKK